MEKRSTRRNRTKRTDLREEGMMDVELESGVFGVVAVAETAAIGFQSVLKGIE